VDILKFTVLLALAITGLSEAAVGTITEQANQPASITRKSTTVTGTKGAGVEMDDAVRTTAGKVGITFTDDTRVQVNENSKLVIDSFVYDPNNKKGGKLAMNVALGTVRYASGAVAHNNPDSVKITTPTATVAVRGTDFTATVDELGRSTIILLPSCPFGWTDVKRDCKTGSIEVTTDEGTVIMNQPFQATRVESRETKPTRPVLLSFLTEDQISNLLILSPPKELRGDRDQRGDRNNDKKGALDIDFLKENGLASAFDKQEQFQDKLSRNFLDTDFLANILDQINAQMAAQLDLLGKTKNGLLPDYVPTSGVTVEVDDLQVTLCREGNSDTQCISVPKGQNTTITQTQGSVEVKNRVNSGGSTIINATQN